MKLPRIPWLAHGGLVRPTPGPLAQEPVRHVVTSPIRGVGKPTEDPFSALHTALVFSSRDWAAHREEAWLYGIIVGWGDALGEVAEQHGWDAETAARLRRLHIAFIAADRTFDGAEAAGLDPWPCPDPDDPEGCYCPGDGPCIADEMSQP